jgi:hypothetical protein
MDDGRRLALPLAAVSLNGGWACADDICEVDARSSELRRPHAPRMPRYAPNPRLTSVFKGSNTFEGRNGLPVFRIDEPKPAFTTLNAIQRVHLL